MAIPDPVRQLERDLREIFGGRLRSLVAYGLGGAHDRADHAHTGNHAATHTMAIVDGLAADDLRACASRVAAWHGAGLATPLILAAHEFEDSLDAFPLEFGAILADHAIVSGQNPFEGLKVDAADVRRACEVQARSHLLHLREGFLEAKGNGDALAVLIVRSAAPFAALLMSLARLQRLDARDPAAVGRQLERALTVAPATVTGIIALASVREIPAADAIRIFPAYLDAVEKLVAFIDGWKA